MQVRFYYSTGLTRKMFRQARLIGSWDTNGHYSDDWTSCPMEAVRCEDGSECFAATAKLDNSQIGRAFQWGVFLDAPGNSSVWGIPTETNDQESSRRCRTFVLKDSSVPDIQEERYYLTHLRRLGANKKNLTGVASEPGIRFTVWAPHAKKVEVVFAGPGGYIADDGYGMEQDPDFSPLPMFCPAAGIWQTGILPCFSKYQNKPYMFKITNEAGRVVFRTDIYSRSQIGQGRFNPGGSHFSGSPAELDGTKSCSVIIDPEKVAKELEAGAGSGMITEEEFWREEFSPTKHLPTRVEDMVIYELHVGALGFGKNRPGNFQDAMDLLDYLSELGINAIELLPIAEFAGWAQWGYGTSHYFAPENSAGGRDQCKHFIRECHRRGIAVIMDVVYNHYHHNAERAQWAYDSDSPEHNIYYWYEGRAGDYPQANPPGHGGYVDNMSTGYAPRYYSEMVRKIFISSAAAFIEHFHVDGFRVDQTTSMHLYNVLHADGRALGHVNTFGAKFLRELTRTLKMIKPEVILMAEDHSAWPMVTEPSEAGGLGFDAAWYADFYHQLCGDSGSRSEAAKLIKIAGYGQDQSLVMDYFSGALSWSGRHKVVYHESHDEAGNSHGSKRTIITAVNNAPLVGETRRSAEARCRLAFGMSLLSPGTPLFLMGEEIGAQKDYRYNDFMDNREDLQGGSQGKGRQLFGFYRELIRLRLSHPGLRSRDIDILHVHNANRVIAFQRRNNDQAFLIAASLNNRPFSSGYNIEHALLSDANWREVFNSDAAGYGGGNAGNLGAIVPSAGGRINVVIPANGFVVLQKEG